MQLLHDGVAKKSALQRYGVLQDLDTVEVVFTPEKTTGSIGRNFCLATL